MKNTKRVQSRLLGNFALYWTNLTYRLKAKDKSKQTLSNSTRKNPSEEQKLKIAIKESSQVLADASSVFPFMLFPDQIIIDRHKLTIIFRKFFSASDTVSVPLEDVRNIQATMGPLFGSLTITSDHFINNTQTITYLLRKDVENIQKLVQGAVLAIKEDVDINNIDTKALKDLLCKLGEGRAIN